jgi:hypothetical protein
MGFGSFGVPALFGRGPLGEPCFMFLGRLGLAPGNFGNLPAERRFALGQFGQLSLDLLRRHGIGGGLLGEGRSIGFELGNLLGQRLLGVPKLLATCPESRFSLGQFRTGVG